MNEPIMANDSNVTSEPSASQQEEQEQQQEQQEQQTIQERLLQQLLDNKRVQSIGIPVGAIVVSFCVTGHSSVIWYYLLVPLWKFIFTIIGTMLGVGLGLGLALHVHEYLTAMHERKLRQDEDAAAGKRGLASPLKKSASLGMANSTSYHAMEEETAYASLMTTAGYDVSDHVLRGQVVKGHSKFFDRFYSFTNTSNDTGVSVEVDPAKWRAVILMKEQWPTLPASVSFELGRFMEFVVRDFIASWYYYIDPGVVYVDEKSKRKLQQKEADEKVEAGEDDDETDNDNNGDDSEVMDPEKPTKAMIFSTARNRPVPMMSAMYQSLGIIFGNLSTRVEGVNLFSLLLIKWTKVLSQTFRVYRKLRKEAYNKEHPNQQLKKQKSLRSSGRSLDQPQHGGEPGGEAESPEALGDVSEMAVAREFLKRGKLHRAVTFGMDVPSLLFGDAKGESCGVGVTDNDATTTTSLTPDQVLEARLFDRKMMHECEVDYNRVLGHRLLRALLPRAEFSSPIIRTMMTEMLAGCILTPLMGTFCPEYLNSWIVMGCAEAPAEEEVADTETKEEESKEEESKEGESKEDDEALMRGWINDGPPAISPKTEVGPELFSDLPIENKRQSIVEPGVEMTHSASILATQPSNDSTDAAVNGVEMTMSQSEFFKPKDEGVVLDDEDEGIDNLDHHNQIEILDSLDEEEAEDNGVVDPVVKQEQKKPLPTADFVLPLLTMSMIDLQRFMDFQECRDARSQQKEVDVKWEDPEMQQSISQLVLVIEAALLHGRRKEKLVEEKEEDHNDDDDDIDDSEKAIEVSITTANFSKLLMEITNDPDEFEDRIMQEEEACMDREPQLSDGSKTIDVWEADPADLSTLRSLIAAWLHTGQAHRVMSVLLNAKHSLVTPFFHKHAFMQSRENGEGFVRQLRQLNGVHILVDTLAVLSSPNMDVNEDGKTAIPKPEGKARMQESLISTATSGLRSSLASEQGESTRKKSARFSFRSEAAVSESEQNAAAAANVPPPMTLPQAYVSSTGLPRFLDFRRNENFASSLRSDRERRLQSWANATKNDTKGLQIICRLRGSSEAGVAAHREMHQVSRIFYAGTNLIALRNGARRKGGEDGDSEASAAEDLVPLSLLTVEMACQRRRLEVPDDDSSFLLRAQPRPLNAIGVHRDQRNHDMSFKCFAATYDEPAFRPGQTKYTGGRYVRKCMLRYFPNDRTAQIVVPNETRHLDQRKDKGAVPTSINVGATAVPFLPSEFLRERHLCQKWTPKGATPRSGSILASSVMETGDFNAVPRSGKAIDFVYRMSLFERPMVELSGKRFMIHDSAAMGPHRADGSSLEMSDAAISVALLSIGSDWEEQDDDVSLLEDHAEVEKQKRKMARRSSIEMGADGYPIVWMKYTRKQGENSITEVKSYRTSYVRAALMVTSARQDAQSQCLVKCVKAGSARSATKQRTEAYLMPTSKLLEYANSSEREKQSVLLRDLKLGMNNIDQAQLRRNGLLSPRYPTEIRGLIAACEGAAQVKDQNALSMPGLVPTITMYKIRCKALIALCPNNDLSEEEVAPFASPDGRPTKLYCEEWIIYRPMKDIQTLHKHLKTQVAPSGQVSAGARLVGAATAAFATGSAHGNQRARRKIMIPSLQQAQKVGALGVTKKVIIKRCEVLTGYFQHLLDAEHPLNRCSELLMFLGAFYPFPPDVKTDGDPVTNKTDPLGRMEMKRVVFEVGAPASPQKAAADADQGNMVASSRSLGDDATVISTQTSVSTDFSTIANESLRTAANLDGSVRRQSNEGAAAVPTEEKKTRVKEIDMIPSIKAKIDEVPLAQVRAALFDVVRYQFDFDNASFFRNRMFSALKTMSFAVATPGEFRKMLYEAHLEHLNADALAGWVKFLTETIFPGGLFMEFSGPTSEEDLRKLSQQAKEVLPQAFPDQLRAVLGTEIVQGGLDMLHEMLQNRVVLRSMSYMLFDLLWLEIFPELHDILTGPAALESD